MGTTDSERQRAANCGGDCRQPAADCDGNGRQRVPDCAVATADGKQCQPQTARPIAMATADSECLIAVATADSEWLIAVATADSQRPNAVATADSEWLQWRQ